MTDAPKRIPTVDELYPLKPQPAPVPNGHAATWDIVLKGIADARESILQDGHDDATIGRLTARCRARDAAGLATYGVRLQPHNGRDSLRDAQEEALDLLVYLTNAVLEVRGGPEAADVLQKIVDVVILAAIRIEAILGDERS